MRRLLLAPLALVPLLAPPLALLACDALRLLNALPSDLDPLTYDDEFFRELDACIAADAHLLLGSPRA